jgi:hypothetical protein
MQRYGQDFKFETASVLEEHNKMWIRGESCCKKSFLVPRSCRKKNNRSDFDLDF